MTTRRTFLQRLGIGIAGGAIVAKAATDARIPTTGPTTRLAEPEPEPIAAPWFETSAPRQTMLVQYWFGASTVAPLRDFAGGGSFITRGPTNLTIGDGAPEVVMPVYCRECSEPLPPDAQYCIFCATEVA